MNKGLVIVRGGGDLATGTVHRLVQSGFDAVVLEAAHPTTIRRTVAFSQAVFDGYATVEGLTAERVEKEVDIRQVIKANRIPLLVDPEGHSIGRLEPEIVIDAIIAKRNTGMDINMAPIVIGLGPGFCAGKDVHAVIETNRGHNLGRVIYAGSAEPDTGNPGIIEGFGSERVIRSPAAGRIETTAAIGDHVKCGDLIASVSGIPVTALLEGILRGLIQEGTVVGKDFKIGDVDPRNKREYCFTISDKARAIAGGVLEAILRLRLINGVG